MKVEHVLGEGFKGLLAPRSVHPGPQQSQPARDVQPSREISPSPSSTSSAERSLARPPGRAQVSRLIKTESKAEQK